MSQYADYIREKTNDCIIEVDDGWATYRFPQEKTVYIVDIYVKPEARRSGVARHLADKIVTEAKAKGCLELIGSVNLTSKDPAQSFHVLLGYGMVPSSAGTGWVIFRKGI